MGYDLESIRARLLRRRDELVQLAKAVEDSRRPVELDPASVGHLSRMDALQAQAMAIEAERRRTLELRRIESALHRLEAGDYGYCMKCGEEIAPKRLELDPTTPVCIACARGESHA
ncbi:MAG TPA: TraR/DksA family transcriptional regulator [Alphaproteobacteria bacterium]